MPVIPVKSRPVVECKRNAGITIHRLKQILIFQTDVHSVKIRHAEVCVISRVIPILPLDAVCPFYSVIPDIACGKITADQRGRIHGGGGGKRAKRAHGAEKHQDG